MNPLLAQWNGLEEDEAAEAILPCCGSRRWAQSLARLRPFHDPEELLNRSDEVWAQLDVADWDEAFASHPRIGEKKAPAGVTAKSGEWSSHEQSGVERASEDVQERLRRLNEEYEQRFGRIYIVCATGKAAEEMLSILEGRLASDDATELREAAEQQRQITHLRLRKWLGL
ncbi:MAG: 2-oxo-4-hydroxy-4-carboxy-5-ureidoimidazoline decarboxylase [Silvibacterium sp.]|nr:2-oxo-4-hydroxy-4-carboxy-5-ureidoimidazoline decarboxylase [Silvibacterium sp.]